MECPSSLWNLLLKRHWPEGFLNSDVSKAITWFENQTVGLTDSEDEPIFIFAAGWRSGSTLLQRLLNSHPRVMIWGEAYEDSLIYYHMAAPLRGLLKRPLNLQFLSKHLPNMPNELASMLTTSWIANLTPPLPNLKRAHHAYFESLFASTANDARRPQWGIKLVRGTSTLAHYFRWLYPKAKILYLFRNPYAAFKSYVNASLHSQADKWYLYYPDYPVNGVIPFMVHWRHCMNGFLESHEEVNALLINFESIINRQALEPLQKYLSLELDSSVLDLKVDFRHDTTQVLTSFERRVIRFIGGEIARRYEYTG